MLDTHVRFEESGDSRKDVHTIVKINDVAGARQFARLTFGYNRAFQQVEIPMVRVTHANGGTSEVLPSAISDGPNPAVEKFPAYHDVRAKSVRILGLQESDTIEYRVVTTTTNHPLAPNFWLEHTFDKSGQVIEEKYELDLPESRNPKIQMDVELPKADIKESRESSDARINYRWNFSRRESQKPSEDSSSKQPDLVVTSFDNWAALSLSLAGKLQPAVNSEGRWIIDKTITIRSEEMTKGIQGRKGKLEAIYDFVSQKIATVDLPLGATGFRARPEIEILTSAYATAEDKYRLIAALAYPYANPSQAFLLGASGEHWTQLARPSVFDHLLIRQTDETGCTNCERPTFWLDPTLEVAPFGVVNASLRGKPAFRLLNSSHGEHEIPRWEDVGLNLPFPSIQRARTEASLSPAGGLSAKVQYTLRGDNELFLRMAFHQTPKEKWKEVAGLLALSDGFRGVITSATASDPMATTDPFTVEYELTQEKFVDWSKKPVRIPALLPQIGLPESTGRNSAGNIELGTPLDVETQVTLHVPEGTSVQTPAGTAVQRDYASYSSKYGFTANTLTALRHIHFLEREVAADRAIDYSSFVQAVQADQAQYFVMDRGAGVKSAALR